MKKQIVMFMLAVMTIGLTTLTSCNKDDSNDQKIEIKLNEVGHDNEGFIGKGLHIEADIVAEAKIKSIVIELVNAQQKIVKTFDFSAVAEYTNVLNTTFHEHITLPETLEEGKYNLVMKVTDMKGGVKSEKAPLELKKISANAPIIKNFSIAKTTGKVGEKIMISAEITVQSPVKEIELELHGNKEYPIEIEGFAGKTGTFKLEALFTVPNVDDNASNYDVHLTVEDMEGRSSTEDVEGFVINK